jgi:hypothetical protein
MEESRGPALYGREQATAVPVGLRERHSGCLRGGGGGRGYYLAYSPAGVWRFGGDGGVKSGSGNLVTACHDLLLFVSPNSSSNQPSNFALRILVLMQSRIILRSKGGRVDPDLRPAGVGRSRGWLCAPRRRCHPSGRRPRYPPRCGSPPGPPTSRCCRPCRAPRI